MRGYRDDRWSVKSACLRRRGGRSGVQPSVGSTRLAAAPRAPECLRFLRTGDTLICTKPDRLARNTAELLKIEADLSARGAGLVIQSMNLDTRNGSTPTARLMLTILAGVATWEREIMLERQRKGIAKAKAEGRYKGRPSSIDRGEGPGIAGADEPDRSGQDAGDREVVGVPADLLTAVSCYGSRSGMVTVCVAGALDAPLTDCPQTRRSVRSC
jgi:hypothetical protein